LSVSIEQRPAFSDVTIVERQASASLSSM